MLVPRKTCFFKDCFFMLWMIDVCNARPVLRLCVHHTNYIVLFYFQACMLLSAGFHTFCCHSELAYQKWLALDLAGISMSLVGMYISSLYYGFFCYWVSHSIIATRLFSFCT